MADHSIVYAKDFVDALKKKHASNSYKKMVSNLESFTLTNKIKSHQSTMVIQNVYSID